MTESVLPYGRHADEKPKLHIMARMVGLGVGANTAPEQRMEERDFTEVELREMLEAATGFAPDAVEGRFQIDSPLRGRRWHVIVEPDLDDRLLVVVTAYCVS